MLIIYQSHATDPGLALKPVGEVVGPCWLGWCESGGFLCSSSVGEVEVIVGVVVVLSLAHEGSNHVDGEGQEGESSPDLDAEVNHESLNEELVSTSVQEVEQPLLGGVGSVMPDVASDEGLLVVEVVLTVPGSVLHLGHSQTFAIDQAHVLGVAELVVSQSASYRELRIEAETLREKARVLEGRSGTYLLRPYYCS